MVYGLTSLPTFWRLASPAADSDIPVHSQIAQRLVAEGQWFSYSLYYPIVHLVTLNESSEFTTRAGATLLLAFFVALKSVGILLAAAVFLGRWIQAWLVTAIVMFSMALPSVGALKDIYLGQLSANVWHNSTSIAAATFVVPSFAGFVLGLQSGQKKPFILGGSSLFLATLFKPSFAVVLLPSLMVVAVIGLLRCKSQRRVLAWMLGACTPTILLAASQYWVTFATPGDVITEKKPVLAPFEVWNHYSSNIPLSLVGSLGCLIAVSFIILPNSDGSERLAFGLSWLMVFVGVLTYALVGERDVMGARVLDGNWTWQVIPALSCAFFISAVGSLRLVMIPRTRAWGGVALGLLLLHLLVGAVYFATVGSWFMPVRIGN